MFCFMSAHGAKLIKFNVYILADLTFSKTILHFQKPFTRSAYMFPPNLARSHTFVEIDHEIISTVLLLPSADSFKKGKCKLQVKVCPRNTG